MKFLNLVLFCSMALSSSAFSSSDSISVERNYEVGSIHDLKENVFELKSPSSDFSVFIDCNRNTFDNPKDDWVGGFNSQKECNAFVKTIKYEKSKGYNVKLRHYKIELTIVTTQ